MKIYLQHWFILYVLCPVFLCPIVVHSFEFNISGYYVRVSSTSEAREKVLNYISVMARPMVMYQNDHPIQWTPVYAGGKVGHLRKYTFNAIVNLRAIK